MPELVVLFRKNGSRNAPGLSNYQRKRNIDTILRIKIED
jgi:hypothetical protein